MSAVARVVHALGDRVVRTSGGTTFARCPAHEDGKASLAIKAGDDGRALLHCHAGCETAAVLDCVGLKASDLFADNGPAIKTRIVARYPYRDETGKLLYEAIRMDPKDFRQRRPNGNGWDWSLGDVRRVLYALPELLKSKGIVFVVEGEKDVETMNAMGFPATTGAGGAGKWRDEYSASLRGRRVIVLPDNDEPGRKHAEQVASSLTGVAAAVRVVRLPGLPPKGDVSNWVEAGGTREKLLALLREKPADDIKRRIAKLRADLSELADLVGV